MLRECPELLGWISGPEQMRKKCIYILTMRHIPGSLIPILHYLFGATKKLIHFFSSAMTAKFHQFSSIFRIHNPTSRGASELVIRIFFFVSRLPVLWFYRDAKGVCNITCTSALVDKSSPRGAKAGGPAPPQSLSVITCEWRRLALDLGRAC
jgi:hypothetical protein